MYLIDTDVISEARKEEKGNAGVRQFFADADSPPEGGGAGWPPAAGPDGAEAGACATSMLAGGVGEPTVGELDIVAVEPGAPTPAGAMAALPAPVARIVRSCSSSSAFLRSSSWLLRSRSRNCW